jgi:hypothetical protein
MMRAALLQSLAAGALLTAGPALADRALLIGIDTYAESGLSLGGASSAADLAEMRELLTGALGYGDGDIAVLADRQATREAVLKNFEALVHDSGAGDRVFLYFSGLGYFEEDAGGDEADKLDETFLPHDAALGSGDPPPIGLGISDDEIADLLKKLDGRKVTVVIDAGHSGIVSREASDLPSGEHGLRAPAIGTKTRAIVVEPRAKAQKAEGAPLDTDGIGTDVAIFTATSGGQAPLIADGYGVFTRAFAEAIDGKAADANHNGIVSNAEILAYVRDASEAACKANKACTLGLTPTLGPATAAGGTPMREAKKADDKLTADTILDYFAKGNSHGVTLEQHPASPVKVGTKDIRFRVTSPAAGNLVLIDLSDDGTLVQLFPNEHTKDDAREGAILANSPITVPDDYYGIRFNATSPTSGTLIALVTTEPIQMPETVKTRKITVIAKEDATGTYLPEIAAALDKPADTHADTETRAIDWSVATLRYEIVK